jgi:hypothetical protein
MTTLATNLSDSAMELRVNAPVTDPAEFYQIDDEIIWVAAVTTTVNATLSPNRTVDTTLWQIKERGVSTSAPASHTSGATVTPLVLGAGGGGGSLAVTDGTTTVAATTLSLPVGTVTDEGGGTAGLAVATLQTTVTLDNDQIKALAVNAPYLELVPAPGPNKQLVPIAVVMRLDTTAGGYTNLGAFPLTVAFENLGQWGVMIPAYFMADEGPAQVIQVTESGWWNGTKIEANVKEGGNATDGVDDRLVLFGTNTGETPDPFTGGNAANSMVITTVYAVVDLTP